MKTRKNLMVLVLLSLFLSVGVADSGVTSNSQTELNQALYSLMEKEGLVDKGSEEDIKEAISEITSDGKIEKSELEDDLTLESDIIEKITKDAYLSKYMPIEKESAEEYIAEIEARCAEIDRIKKESDEASKSADEASKAADEASKAADEYKKLSDTIEKTIKALGGD